MKLPGNLNASFDKLNHNRTLTQPFDNKMTDFKLRASLKGALSPNIDIKSPTGATRTRNEAMIMNTRGLGTNILNTKSSVDSLHRDRDIMSPPIVIG